MNVREKKEVKNKMGAKRKSFEKFAVTNAGLGSLLVSLSDLSAWIQCLFTWHIKKRKKLSTRTNTLSVCEILKSPMPCNGRTLHHLSTASAGSRFLIQDLGDN